VKVLNSPYIITPVVDSAFAPEMLQLCGILHSKIVLKRVSRLPVDCAGSLADIAALQLARFDQHQHDEDVDVLNEMNVNDCRK